MKNFDFVFVAKDEKFKMPREMTSLFEESHPNINFNYVANNTNSLADVYNMFINKHRKDKDCDYLVLMHADVSLDLEKLVEHIESVDGKYDVIGLCGCSKISVSQKPLNWWTGSNPFPEHKWGCVSHGELGNQVSFFSRHHEDITDHEVACIDGLCIILSRNAIENTDLSFDNTFTFSHYDTDFSFECVLKKHLKLGVIIRKDLQHWSVGRSILTPEFLESEKKFRTKWNLDQVS